MKMDQRETATVLAALRTFQRRPDAQLPHFDEIAPLSVDEIDCLCERINTGEDDEPDEAKTVFVLIQEGGSSAELYVHVRDTLQAAEAHRRECARASYRTSEPVEFPARLFETPGFLDAIQALVVGGLRCEYAA